MFAAFMWYWFIQQIILGVSLGNNPAPNVVTMVLWLFFGIAFPVFMFRVLKLVTEVREEGIYIRFFSFSI
ncbi:DUF6141 family protein [Bacillus carboniphilus]|uniref:DUF6141 family protein n=1 Tax=Bacillus carboniphilus TaxID=86663 RepID=A0ABY9JRK3_9BACI|nr:DUF6141 family protein [Bacillus carboniphilus]WLR42037.1 DUF6141 family protein [Bacillus carboniphilus]